MSGSLNQTTHDPPDIASLWVRRIIAENNLQTTWGYAVFYSPSIETSYPYELECRHDHMLHAARVSVGCTEKVMPNFRLQILEWPGVDDDSNDDMDEEKEDVSTKEKDLLDNAVEPNVKVAGQQAAGSNDLPTDDDDDDDNDDHEDKGKDDEDFDTSSPSADEISLGSQDTSNGRTPSVGDIDPREDEASDASQFSDADVSLVETFAGLRARFKWWRDHPPRKWLDGLGHQMSYGGLDDGILDNVFLVFDQDSADSCLQALMADQSWVWAVDPEFDDTHISMETNGLEDEYMGYLRVRIQQLVNNFYEARHFRPEVTLRDLWEAAKLTRNHAFASLDSEDARQWSTLPNHGSLLTKRA